MNALWRIIFRGYRLASWLRYRLARRLTRTGLLLLAGIVLSGVMSVDMDSTVAYQVFTTLICLGTVSLLFGWRFRAKFSAERRLPRFGTVGQPFQYTIAVRNRSGRPQNGLVLIDDLADSRPGFSEWLAVKLAEQKSVRSLRFIGRQYSNPFKPAEVKEAVIPQLAPNGEAEVRIELKPLRRGVLRFRGVTLARPDPLGLFRALGRLPLPDTALILPRRHPLPPIALPGVMKYQEGGIAQASSVGQSEEFVSLRDYRRGDPLRRVHWRSWARTGRPIVKEFADEFFVRHALVLDTFGNDPHNPVFEEAVSVAASFACTIQSQESLLDLLFVGAQAYCFTAGRGLAHADQMLEVLASVSICTDKPFSLLENQVLNHSGVVSGCVCVLLAWDAPRQRFVEKLKAMGVPVLVVVVLGAGARTDLDPGPMRNELDHFHTLTLGQIEEGLARL
jgi:uncharacterized protein (DUF58 family)